MSLRGLGQATADLNNIGNMVVPWVSIQIVNCVATRAVSRSVTIISKDTWVPHKLVKQRARIKRAMMKKLMAMVHVNRGDLPAIKLGTASTWLSRRKQDKKGTNGVSCTDLLCIPGTFV